MGSVGRLGNRGIGLVLLSVGVVTLGADLGDAGLKRNVFERRLSCRLTISMQSSSAGSLSPSPRWNVSFLSEGGVGRDAKGYSLESSEFKSRGPRTNKGG